MSRFVLDTDILTRYYHGDPNVLRNVRPVRPSDLAITVVTVDEQLTGWYTVARRVREPAEIARAYASLAEAVVHMSQWRILPYTEGAIARVAQLKALRLNVGLMDLRIAAIALEHQAIVVTCNRRDFGRVPGLNVEDWSI